MIRLNEKDINLTTFPDKTTQVWKLPYLDSVSEAEVVWDFESENEFLHAAQLKSLLDSKNIPTTLLLSYLPYGRQDKEVSNNATFALNTFALLLNALSFKKVLIIDPHSSVALDIINNSVAIYPTDQLSEIIEDTKPDLFCYPDKGALTKYKNLSIYNSRDFVYGEKVREPLTGNITKYDLQGSVENKKVLIIDDICDGGATFKLLAKDLLAAGAVEVNLFVTHGLFSKGLRPLKDSGISRIFSKTGECID